MARFNIDLLGDKALADTLAGLTDKMERTVLVSATRDAGKFFLTLSKAAAPVSSDPRDPHRGRLKATLKLRPLRRKKGRVGVAIQTGTREELGIIASTNISYTGSGSSLRVKRGKTTSYYPAHVELGHKNELGTRQYPPNPYMRGPLHSAREAVLAVLRQSMNNGIERELTKAGL